MTQDPRIDRLEAIVEELRHEVHALRTEVNSRFASLESRMLQMFLGILGVQLTGFIALGVAILLKS